jgi:hypothetical protein
MEFKLKSKVVEFVDSDGKVVGCVTVTQATFLSDQLLDEMQQAALEQNEAEVKALGEKTLTPEQVKVHAVRYAIYPKMAACSSGDVPTLEDVIYRMPITESDKWWNAAKEINPSWFEVFADIEKMSDAEKKKKQRKRAGSSRVSVS